MISIFYIILPFLTLTLRSQIPEERLVDWSNAGAQTKINYERIVHLSSDELNISGTSNSDIVNGIINNKANVSTLIVFPEGSFVFEKPIIIGKSNVGIKGQGVEKTELIFDLPGKSSCINISGFSQSIYVKVQGDIKFRSKSIVVDAINLLNNAKWLKIACQDKDLVSSNWAIESVAQIQRINSISGDTVYFESEFRKDFLAKDSINLTIINPVENISIECLKIKRLDNSSPEQTSNISFQYTANSVVSNIESENCNFSHIEASNSSNITISNSYFHHSFEYGGGGRAYGVMLQFSTGEVLVQNNVFEHLRHSMITQAGANGNVFAYNYSFDPFWSETSLPANSSGDMVLHGNYPFANLFESNICQNIVIDNSHGANGTLNTFFRNRAELWGIFFSANTSPKQNFIANEITNNTFPYNLVNYNILGEDHYIYANNNKGTLIPDKPAPLNIKSLFNKSKPDFLDDTEFGGIGFPSNPNENSISAKRRYESGDIFNSSCNSLPNKIKSESGELMIYPNPANEQIVISNIGINNSLNNIEIIDLYGNKVNNYKVLSDNLIDISQLKCGIYFIYTKSKIAKFIKS